MNKKFSTLVAALLLSGALCTVEAKDISQGDFNTLVEAIANNAVELPYIDDGKFTLTSNIDLGENTYLLITQNNLVIDGQGKYTLKGRLAIVANGVTVQNLKIDNVVKINNGSFWKNAITVVGKSATIVNNQINCSADESFAGSSKQIANGIVVFPTDQEVSFMINGNTIDDANVVSSDGTLSAGILIAENCNYPTGSNTQGYSKAIKSGFDASSLADNNFNCCYTDYSLQVWDPAGTDSQAKALQITPIVNEDGTIANAGALDALNTHLDADITFRGTADQLNKALENVTIESDIDIAVVCTKDKTNVLFGDAQNPDNGYDAVVSDIKALDESINGYKLLATNNGKYNLLVVKSNASQAGDNYVITLVDGKIALTAITKDNPLNKYASKANALWKMTESKDLDGKVYYSFECKEKGVILKATGEAGTGVDGRFFPANGAKYNNGVVFNVDGGTLNEAKKNYFGLYEAGDISLTVKDLNFFEQDGFSVTITTNTDNDNLLDDALDSESNPFVGHLTPMWWTGSEFVTFEHEDAPDPATTSQFYLMNSEGNYIVVNSKDNGEVDAEDVLYFTTVSEQALEHDLARISQNDPQEYFGFFSASVSASNQTDLTKLTTIDKLTVEINGAAATVGRWDKDGVPTLAASIETSLKPILISLGSDKIVDKTKFLKKGKFYTVEVVASSIESDGRVGKKLVAYAADDDRNNIWVESYGNVLEGQFALTIETSSDNKEYYVFKNRENLERSGYSMFREFTNKAGEESLGIPVAELYQTDKENEYRFSAWTLKIETVANHAASDGYETLADVKNNKFYIGYSSDVFQGNAWLTENHEGDKNHVIGLDIDQENALEFTAKEYSAARQLKVENTNTHRYEYIPTDSIYVISELGFFDNNKYKTTPDTLKLVSYTFVNQFTEPLVYNGLTEQRYESQVFVNGTDDRFANVEDAQKAAQHFALRIDGTKLNLRPVTIYEGTRYSETEYNQKGDEILYQVFADNDYSKVYSGDTEKGILSNTYYLDRRENDLFVVEPTEKPMYRTVINPLDTISIFRNDNSQSILFEQNTFLGMENMSQYPNIAPAMIADTAYVRYGTYRPQYMLVVGSPKVVPAGRWCPIHGDDPSCPDAHKQDMPGWVEGRYLVNLVDTAIAWDNANKHKDNNPYINSEKYYRLGFVQAKHINDSLVIASTNDTLFVGSEDYNQAKFAFRYVDQEEGSFVIETANYKRLPNVTKAEMDGEGYLKWMNGVVVVVDNINNADVYNMNEDEHRNPTANESVEEAIEGVTVIAGNGTVTIQGAAGKQVIVSNILGKVVANTVLTSDNATISVPAGIVAVAVEGEEAIKAIVK